jgi:hypothetical protein
LADTCCSKLQTLLQVPAGEEGQRARPVNRVQAGIRRRQRAAAAAQQQQQQQEAAAEQESASEVSHPPLIAPLALHEGAAGSSHQYSVVLLCVQVKLTD